MTVVWSAQSHDSRTAAPSSLHDRPSFAVQARRSKVTEIVAADGMVFVLCHSGSCTAFCRGKLTLRECDYDRLCIYCTAY